MKYPRTKDGLRKRRNNIDSGYSKHRAGLNFNRSNGEPNTQKWLDYMRSHKLRRDRALKMVR